MIDFKRYSDVDWSLQELGRAILDSKYAEEFANESVENALKMLQDDQGRAGELFGQFLIRHGHRSVKEFDFYTETWGINPRSLIQVLQTLVANPSRLTAAPVKDQGESSIQNIQNKPKMNPILKFIVSRARHAVICREKTKSLTIRSIHHLRLAYRRLGQLMVNDGKIPDAGLVFFFTHSELEQVINSRGAPLITKAVRRRKLHPEMNALVFPEISLGIPKAIQQKNQPAETGTNGVQILATPVFKGSARAKARVALNLEEARNIQCGEVLITYSTDIGWSPYFPLLSGVVTEIGGLISHGAVVAREYVSSRVIFFFFLNFYLFLLSHYELVLSLT